jgi:SAM-dependent methyltransferase
MLHSMATHVWGREIAEAYDTTSAARFAPDVLNPTVDFLAALSAGGRALELAVGTGRVALPLSARGVDVHGIELSPHMAEQLRAKPGADAVPVTVGDMTSTRAPGSFELVYLLWNTIMNVTTQDEQVAVFANAAAHLAPGGTFVVEVAVPHLAPPGERARVFALEEHHIGIDTFDDPVDQVSWSHHWMVVEGRLVHHAAPFRYVWPSELDLMARLAGLRLRERWAGWHREPFTSDSAEQVVVYEKVGSSDGSGPDGLVDE